MNIQLLKGTLEVAENPGLETIDSRFIDITTLVQNGLYQEAANKAEEILEEKIYDIRIVGYFLYGHFIEYGVIGLKEVFSCLAELLRDNLAALGPVRNQKKHIQTILTWLVKQTIKILQFEESNPKGLFRDWAETTSSDDVQEVVDALEDLRRAVGPVLEDAAGPVVEGLMKNKDWLVSFQRLIYKEPEPEAAPEAEERDEEAVEEQADAEEFAAEEEAGGEQQFDGGEASARDYRQRAEAAAPGIEGSVHLHLLMKKMKAFERLISSQNFAGAAVVADDIQATIANFDPRIYFPKLFVSYSKLVAVHINSLASYAEYKETPSWQALVDLYKTDLKSFLEFNPESVEPAAASGDDPHEDDY